MDEDRDERSEFGEAEPDFDPKNLSKAKSSSPLDDLLDDDDAEPAEEEAVAHDEDEVSLEAEIDKEEAEEVDADKYDDEDLL